MSLSTLLSNGFRRRTKLWYVALLTEIHILTPYSIAGMWRNCHSHYRKQEEKWRQWLCDSLWKWWNGIPSMFALPFSSFIWLKQKKTFELIFFCKYIYCFCLLVLIILWCLLHTLAYVKFELDYQRIFNVLLRLWLVFIYLIKEAISCLMLAQLSTRLYLHSRP